jgi:hypothetical protein
MSLRKECIFTTNTSAALHCAPLKECPQAKSGWWFWFAGCLGPISVYLWCFHTGIAFRPLPLNLTRKAQDQTKAHVVVAIARLVRIPVRRARVPRLVDPRAATQHARRVFPFATCAPHSLLLCPNPTPFEGIAPPRPMLSNLFINVFMCARPKAALPKSVAASARFDSSQALRAVHRFAVVLGAP